ncbi:MAG TPA: electron transfer flavoprotein subunit beta/FixA family protein [Deltaproteobacteria bacterium]|nr:electron transfer flavoprotein subunit beta/FixA family protein [Deltaproteobacteria bacterium]
MAVNIVVLLKQTPDTESVIRIASDGKSIVTDDLKWIINPYDEYAVEVALRLMEQHGGTVVILSWGPNRVVESMRTALAMGADSGVLIDDPDLEGADSLGVAKALAAAAKQLNPDIVLCGSRAVDYDLAQRGAMVAEFLGWPHVALAISLECDGSKVTVDRPIEGGKVSLQADLPALVTFGGSHGIWNPRYASLPGIMKAKKKPIEMKKLSDIGLNGSECGAQAIKMRIASLEMPPQRAPGRIVEGADAAVKAHEVVRQLHEEAKLI